MRGVYFSQGGCVCENQVKYFANPGPDGRFNPDFYFHWVDFNNEPINDWKTLASTFLSIPMAHQLIGFYTVADDTDGILKVMRSYQYYQIKIKSTFDYVFPNFDNAFDK